MKRHPDKISGNGSLQVKVQVYGISLPTTTDWPMETQGTSRVTVTINTRRTFKSSKTWAYVDVLLEFYWPTIRCLVVVSLYKVPSSLSTLGIFTKCFLFVTFI